MSDTNTEVAEKIIRLETLVAEQEYTISQLNDVVVEHEFAIIQLTKQVKSLKKLLLQQVTSNIAKESEETPPPHY